MSSPSIEIGDADWLLRRMADHWISADGEVQSVAFFDRRNDLSVDIERLRSVAEVWLATGQRCARLLSGEVRALGCEVVATPSRRNPAHAAVRARDDMSTSQRLRLARSLRDIATLLDAPG